MSPRSRSFALTLLTLAATSALAATAPADSHRLASDYAAWAGGRDNAQALITGLRSGSSITLATHRADRTLSLAGFTPQAPMSDEEIRAALGSARSSLASMGIQHPDAEQIQAALIGGEVALPRGGARYVKGQVAVRGGNPQLATR